MRIFGGAIFWWQLVVPHLPEETRFLVYHVPERGQLWQNVLCAARRRDPTRCLIAWEP